MNINRFLSLPNALKPLILLFLLLTMLLAASAQTSQTPNGLWFFWLNIILQLVFMAAICGCFLYDTEIFLSCGREDSWPVVEMTYSGAGALCNFLNIFILASAQKKKDGSNSYVVAAFTSFFLLIFYAIGGLMMFRIWRGFVKSGASQNPTPNVQAGDIGGMHPGV